MARVVTVLEWSDAVEFIPGAPLAAYLHPLAQGAGDWSATFQVAAWRWHKAGNPDQAVQ